MRCGHRTLRLSEINEHFVGVDAHIDPRSEEKRLGSLLGELAAKPTEGFCRESAETLPASPCCKGRYHPSPLRGGMEKSAKKTAAPKDATVSFLSVYKRFNLLAQKNGNYHLRTVKGDIGNNSGQKCLLEVHACLICQPERTEKITHCRAQCHAQKRK